MGRGQGLGGAYRRLWTASTVSTLGDGMYLAALPLLAATLTRDPLPVSLVTVAGWLPWLLFALPAGGLVDRLDRRRVIWTVDAARAAVVGALTVAGFLVGAGQTLVENAAQAMVVLVCSQRRSPPSAASSAPRAPRSLSPRPRAPDPGHAGHAGTTPADSGTTPADPGHPGTTPADSGAPEPGG